MKLTKLAALVISATSAMSGVSSAAVIGVNVFANGTVGLIGLQGSTAISGRVIIVSTTADIGTALSTNLSPLLTLTPPDAATTSVEFNNALTLSLGTTNATSPGIIRSANFANGAISSLGSVEVGAAGNFSYMLVVAESEGNVNGFGVYTNAAFPSLGAITFNPAAVGDGLGIGTSTLASGIGYQLAPVTIIPEPSAALLGALGALGLLRRRRI
jgi:hypothetical protein